MMAVSEAASLLGNWQERRVPVCVQCILAGVLVCLSGVITDASAETLTVQSQRDGSRVELLLRGAAYEYLEGAAARAHSRDLDCGAAVVIQTSAGTVKVLAMNRATNSPVLSGWKDIASYCGRGVRTVQRWERELQMPVHRPRSLHGPVIALEEELRGWLGTRETLARQADNLVVMLNDRAVEAKAGQGSQAIAG